MNEATRRRISVVADFSDEPFGRFPSDGPNNATRFREEILVPALRRYDQVIVDLNGAFFGSSFLEEAFGGMVRFGQFRQHELRKKLEILHNLEIYVRASWRYIKLAEYGSTRQV